MSRLCEVEKESTELDDSVIQDFVHLKNDVAAMRVSLLSKKKEKKDLRYFLSILASFSPWQQYSCYSLIIFKWFRRVDSVITLRIQRCVTIVIIDSKQRLNLKYKEDGEFFLLFEDLF